MGRLSPGPGHRPRLTFVALLVVLRLYRSVPTSHKPSYFLKRTSKVSNLKDLHRGADKSLARPTSRCILFDGENISFDASLLIYINSTNIPPIMFINRIYEKIFCSCSLFPSWSG
jgi:hypothetical protein